MTVLSSLYGIIMDCVVNATIHGNNVFDGLITTNNRYSKVKMEPIGKLGRKNTSNIEIIPNDSKDVSINFSYQCIHIIKNKERLNGLKGSTKIQKRESLFKY